MLSTKQSQISSDASVCHTLFESFQSAVFKSRGKRGGHLKRMWNLWGLIGLNYWSARLPSTTSVEDQRPVWLFALLLAPPVVSRGTHSSPFNNVSTCHACSRRTSQNSLPRHLSSHWRLEAWAATHRYIQIEGTFVPLLIWWFIHSICGNNTSGAWL